jgi:hypothetical protein
VAHLQKKHSKRIETTVIELNVQQMPHFAVYLAYLCIIRRLLCFLRGG